MTRLYTSASGKPISAKTIRAGVDAVIDAETVKIRDVAQKLVDGSINIPEWQIQTTAIIKNLHVAVGLIATGGYENTSNSDLARLSNKIKEQYKYLRSFAKQVRNGMQPLNGSLVSRAALYTQAARGTYEDTVRQAAKESGEVTQEKRVLGAADHCQGCLDLASQGWQPLGTLPGIGDDTPCMANCHCSFIYQ
jgi:hypothetical protein